jgi:methionyl-tRNA formyltransferase
MDKHEKVWYGSVKEICNQFGIAVEEKKNVDEEDSLKIQKMKPDLILSAGWRRLIPSSVFKIPKFGTVNLHDGLIPAYRGFAPINWAIINGENEAGITTHFIDEGMDTGAIILQKKVSIGLSDTSFDVYTKLLSLSSELLLDTIRLVETGKAKPVFKTGSEGGFFCARRFPDDGKINWDRDRMSIYNLIRALSDPYPNAFCLYNGDKIHIKKAKLVEDDYRGLPGRICSITNEGVIVTCGTNHKINQGLLIMEIGVNGKKMKAKDFFNKLWENLE